MFIFLKSCFMTMSIAKSATQIKLNQIEVTGVLQVVVLVCCSIEYSLKKQ